jgi:hypothetical protein
MIRDDGPPSGYRNVFVKFISHIAQKLQNKNKKKEEN